MIRSGAMSGQGDTAVIAPFADHDLSWALHHLAVASATVDTALAQRLKLSAGDYLALKHLLSADPPIGPVELGRLLGISSGSATTLVDRLEQVGYVERHNHPGDRRRLIVRPTPMALALVADRFAPLKEKLDELAATFTGTERVAIHAFLTEVATVYRHFAASPVRRAGMRTAPGGDG
jgi:DNA-binding MarR family transcriptional regulator